MPAKSDNASAPETSPGSADSNTFRFVHTADLHLDSPLKSLALVDPELRELIDGATRRTLERIIDLCIEEHVDALLIAGDLHDRNVKSMKTAAALSFQMRRLADAGVPVYLIKGNHDAESKVQKALTLPDNVHVFDGRKAGTLLIDDRAAIHGISFAKPQAPESLLPKYAAPVEGRFNIGLMHTSLNGSEGHDAYAPCSLTDLLAHGYDYWALGHIHKRTVHATQPAVVMPGIPQGRDIGEAGPRSVTLVTLSADAAPLLEEHAVHVAGFERVEIDVTAITEWADLIRATVRAMQEQRATDPADELIARIQFNGHTSLAWQLINGAEQLLEELRLEAERIGHLWIEKLTLDVQRESNTESAIDELPTAQLLTDGVLGSEILANATQSEWQQLMKALPADLRTAFGNSEEEQRQQRNELMHEGIAQVLSHLQGTATDGTDDAT